MNVKEVYFIIIADCGAFVSLSPNFIRHSYTHLPLYIHMRTLSVQKPYSQNFQYRKNITDIRVQEDIKKHIFKI